MGGVLDFKKVKINISNLKKFKIEKNGFQNKILKNCKKIEKVWIEKEKFFSDFFLKLFI